MPEPLLAPVCTPRPQPALPSRRRAKHRRRFLPTICLLIGLTAGLVGGAARAAETRGVLPPLVEGDRVGAGWVFQGLPDQTLPRTRYDVAVDDGSPVLRVSAEGSYGHLVHTLPVPRPAGLLQWRWRLDQGNPAADLRQRQGDDNPIKVCASFALPPQKVPFFERQLLRLAQTRTGQPLPLATLCYVWDLREAAGVVLDNAYTRRVRLWVLQSGQPAMSSGGAQAWMAERRDLAADFRIAFGDEWPASAGPVPAVTAVWVSGDADNTGGRSVARVANLQWVDAPAGAAR